MKEERRVPTTNARTDLKHSQMQQISKPFVRGLDKPACTEVASFLDSQLGRDLLACEDGGCPRYQLFIRNNSVDFYWRGCRVLSFHPLESKNKHKINRAYMEDGEIPVKQRKDVALVQSGDDLLFKDASFRRRVIERPEEALSRYVKGTTEDDPGEKHKLFEYWRGHRRDVFLDVEIAFSVQQGNTHQKAYRVDLVVVHPGSNALKFVEAKLDTYSVLRSREHDPRVIGQMELYRLFLSEQREQITSSYRLVIENILALGLAGRFVSSATPTEAEVRLKSLASSLEVDLMPGLLVFVTKAWNDNDHRHWGRLKKLLEEHNFTEPMSWPPLGEATCT